MNGTVDIERVENEDWYVIHADYEIELMIKRLIPTHKTVPLKVRVHPENTRYLRMIMGEFPLEIKSTDKWKGALDKIAEMQELAKSLNKLNYVEPDGTHFIGKLLPFQQEGLDFLLKTKGQTLITDEMGLGKTIQTLAFLATAKDAFPAVIVSPLTTLVNWKREIERFIRLDTYLKGSQSRLDQLSAHMPIIEMIRTGEDKPLNVADIYIINYDLLGRRLKNLKAVNPRTVVGDEIQYVRNSYTGRYEAMRELALQSSVKYRIGLSGTPIYNKGAEMYNIIEIIKSGLLGEREEFIRRYCNKVYYYSADNETSEEGKIGLSKILRNTIMIRRKKADVLPDLPEKVKMKQVIPIDTNLYTAELGKLFNKIELAKESLSTMVLEDEKKEGLFALNKKVQEMRQGERQIAGLAKAPFVVDYMKNLLTDYEEEKFVIFCHHISVHEIIYERLSSYGAVQIIGGQSDKQRQEAIDKFQNDKKTRVIICGLRAGNLGISLTKSTYVIFAELDWSPAVHWQAEDRLHRIGQTKTVFAHYLEGEDTFDEIISQILLNKNMIINDVLGDKMERLNNNQAIQFLQEKYKFGKESRTLQILEKTTQLE